MIKEIVAIVLLISLACATEEGRAETTWIGKNVAVIIPDRLISILSYGGINVWDRTVIDECGDFVKLNEPIDDYVWINKNWVYAMSDPR